MSRVSVVTRSKAHLNQKELDKKKSEDLIEEDTMSNRDQLEPIKLSIESEPEDTQENPIYLLPESTGNPVENPIIPQSNIIESSDEEDVDEPEYFIQEFYQTKIKAKTFDQVYYLYSQESTNMKQNLDRNQIPVEILDNLAYDSLTQINQK